MKLSFKSDEHILHGIKNDRNKALNFIYKGYFPLIKNHVKKNSGTEEDAKDIFQDALVIFYEKVVSGNFVLTSSIKTYIFSVCQKMWLKKLRSIKINDPMDNHIDELPVHLPVFEIDKKALKPLKQILNEQMEKLGNPCKSILISYYYTKQSMEQIANKLGYNNSHSARNQKYKCLQRLKSLVMSGTKDLKEIFDGYRYTQTI